MEIKKMPSKAEAIKITIEENGKIVGHAFLNLIYNDLHKEPYGLLEDVFVKETKRGGGIGTKLVNAVIDEAQQNGCYKLIAASRHERKEVHKWYEKLSFKNHGIEFRIDFK